MAQHLKESDEPFRLYYMSGETSRYPFREVTPKVMNFGPHQAAALRTKEAVMVANAVSRKLLLKYNLKWSSNAKLTLTFKYIYIYEIKKNQLALMTKTSYQTTKCGRTG